MRLVYEPGQELSFGLVLIGRAPGILPTLRRRATRDGSHWLRTTGARAYAYRSERSWDTSTRIVYDARDNIVWWHALAADLGGLRVRAMPAACQTIAPPVD
jgi:hypothetical protein